MHTLRCTFAKSKIEKCRCNCKGKLHGVDENREYISSFEVNE